MNKKVMIVGAGIGQVNLLKICQQRGYDVFVVSIPGDYPCFKLTNNIKYADITDKDAVLKIALQEKIDAVVSDQNDMAVTTVAYIAEKMGLRGIGYETALKFTNKYEMRKSAKAAGIDVPEFTCVKSLEEAQVFANKIGYPLMIKPVDGWSSRGVHKINSSKELQANFKDSLNYSIKKSVIIEEFIRGTEYLVDGFAMDNKYVNLDLGTKEYFNIPNMFISSMCMFTSSVAINDRIEKMVLNSNKRLVEKMGLKFGITHAEYLYSPYDDKVYLVEIAARGGGIYLSSDITPMATGFNTNIALIDYVVEGEKTFPDETKLNSKVSAWKCFALPEGKIISISSTDKLKSIDGVYKIDFSKIHIGMETELLKNDNGKYGPILVVADNREQCNSTIDKIKNNFNIKVETVNGIKDIIW